MNASLCAVATHPFTEEISRLYNAGFSLLPLGGGADGKSPITRSINGSRLPLAKILGPMIGRGSQCYGLRLTGLAVVDCDVQSSSLIATMEERFGRSQVHIATPRGVHLYYLSTQIKMPNLRAEGLPVDVKAGPSSYVMGPHSIRPDGLVYSPLQGVLGETMLSEISFPQPNGTANRQGLIEVGDRNSFLLKEAIQMVQSVDDPSELFANLIFIRDEQCSTPDSVRDAEVQKIADWAWRKRLESKIYINRDSEFRLNRLALDILRKYPKSSDAISLLTTLQAYHGHIIGKRFALNYEAMRNERLTSLSRERFIFARRTLEQAGLLAVAKEYSVGKSGRLYQLRKPIDCDAGIAELSSAMGEGFHNYICERKVVQCGNFGKRGQK